MDDPILQKSYFKKLLQARTLTYKTVRKPMKANEKFTLHIVNHFTIEKLRTTAKMYGMATINNNGQVIVQLGKFIQEKQQCDKIL